MSSSSQNNKKNNESNQGKERKSPIKGLSFMVAAHATLLALSNRALRHPELAKFIQSDAFLDLAFSKFEAAVNLWSAAMFLLAPSFVAHQLAPYFDAADPGFAHPALRVCVRLFGATEILVGLLFAKVLTRENSDTFLKCVLVGDLVHYAMYVEFSTRHFKLEPSVVAHYFTMTAVLYTKYLWLNRSSSG